MFAAAHLPRSAPISADTDVEVKSKEIFSFVVGQLLMARINNDLDFIENNLENAIFNLIGLKT